MHTVFYDTKKQMVSLQGSRSTYAIKLYNSNLPMHMYWGPKIGSIKDPGTFFSHERAFAIRVKDRDTSFFIEEMHFEYGFSETGDFRIPAFSIRDGRNYPVTGPFETVFRIHERKPEIQGLPAARMKKDEKLESLEIVMSDTLSGLEISLHYTMFPEDDALVRNVSFHNRGDSAIRIEKAASMSLDILNRGFELLYLPGVWAGERRVMRTPLVPGSISFGSTRGISSHQFNPACALLEADTNEFRGSAYGFNLIYSGNFLTEFELNQDQNVRINMGIHPDSFEWQLEPEQRFDTPEAVLVYSDGGINGMSGQFHRFIQERIVPPGFKHRERPVLFNNWEATYFNFDEKVLKELTDGVSDLGIELFVLDDGWFEGRNSDETSLGDWYADRKKLPGGLRSFGEYVEKKGMLFGLWIEPEMISRRSELAQLHPDWHISNPGRPLSEGRNQLVLDLSRTEVCDFLIDTVDKLLSSALIQYVKWDMNRYITGFAALHLPVSRQKEVYHRYILGLYRIMKTITEKYPEVLFEGCAGGGGRFDLGILFFMPQFWTSDNTDAVSRIRIQYGTSIFYPPITMGAHVSIVPNHQVGRCTPLKMRACTAMSGNLGYELDLRRQKVEELEEIRQQIQFYKKYRRLIQFGRFIRLQSPFDTNEAAWMFLEKDGSDFIFFWFRLHAEAEKAVSKIRLSYLVPDKIYREDSFPLEYTGSELMHGGLPLPQVEGEYASLMFVFHGN